MQEYELIYELNMLEDIDSGRLLLQYLKSGNYRLVFVTSDEDYIDFEVLLTEGLQYDKTLKNEVKLYRNSVYLYSVSITLPNLFLNNLTELYKFLTTDYTNIGLFANRIN